MKNHHSNLQSNHFLEFWLQRSSGEFLRYFGFWFFKMNSCKHLGHINPLKIHKMNLINRHFSYLGVGVNLPITPLHLQWTSQEHNSQTTCQTTGCQSRNRPYSPLSMSLETISWDLEIPRLCLDPHLPSTGCLMTIDPLFASVDLSSPRQPLA